MDSHGGFAAVAGEGVGAKCIDRDEQQVRAVVTTTCERQQKRRNQRKRSERGDRSRATHLRIVAQETEALGRAMLAACSIPWTT